MKRKLLALATAVGWCFPLAAGTASKLDVVLEVEPSPNLPAQVAGVEETLALLAQRGWPVQGMRIRLAREPFDATRFAADVVLPTSLPPEDNAFLLVRGVVARLTGGHPWGEVLADCVAAHLAPPSSRLRREWEAAWQRKLLAGELERTALLELVWRQKGDAGVRQVAEGQSPWRLLGADAAGLEEPLWEVALAGLLAPSKLGFAVGPVSWDGLAVMGGDGTFRFVAPSFRFLALEGEAEALGLMPTRLRRATARAVVLYDDGRFDTLSLGPGEEAVLPRLGVQRVVLAVLSLPGEALASFALREVRDYPVRLGEVEVVQQDNTLQLAWEVEQQQDVVAYVVEVWGVSRKPTLQERSVIPSSEAGPAKLFWAWEAAGEPVQVRVYALTRGGLLAKLFTTPSFAASGQQLDEAP